MDIESLHDNVSPPTPEVSPKDSHPRRRVTPFTPHLQPRTRVFDGDYETIPHQKRLDYCLKLSIGSHLFNLAMGYVLSSVFWVLKLDFCNDLTVRPLILFGGSNLITFFAPSLAFLPTGSDTRKSLVDGMFRTELSILTPKVSCPHDAAPHFAVPTTAISQYN